jgi:hypothetical protein
MQLFQFCHVQITRGNLLSRHTLGDEAANQAVCHVACADEGDPAVVHVRLQSGLRGWLIQVRAILA